jgi:hypothetical protein
MDHLKSLRTLNFVIGAYTVLFGLLFLVMWVIPGLWAWWEGENAGLIAVIVGIIAFLFVGGLGAAHVVVGYLVGSGRGRVAQTFLAAMQLMSFPVGTLYAVYALWVCWVDPASSRKLDDGYKPPIA